MAVYHAESLIFGPYNERPELSDPTIYSASGIALFLATDTGGLYETSGSAWTLLGTLMGASLPGVTSDGADGLAVAQNIVVGNMNAAIPRDQSYLTFYGNTTMSDTPVSASDSDDVAAIQQTQPLTANTDARVLVLTRGAGDGSHVYTSPVLAITDGAQNVASQGHTVLIVDHLGAEVTIGGGEIRTHAGIGRFNTPPPNTASSITGALSSVTDANAKDVLTSIIGALIADGGATNDTT